MWRYVVVVGFAVVVAFATVVFVWVSNKTKHFEVVKVDVASDFCDKDFGYDWRRELQKIHVDVMMGNRDNFGTRVTFTEMFGLGDRLRAASAGVIYGTLAEKAPILTWRRKNGDYDDVLLNDFFVPRQFYWNASEVSNTVLDGGSESVWDDYHPPGMAEERQRLSFTDVASMLGSSRIPDDIVDVIRNDVKKQQVDLFRDVKNKTTFVNFLNPHKLHYGLITNFQILQSWEDRLRCLMANTDALHNDNLKLRNTMVTVGRSKPKVCSIRMLFDTFAPPLRRVFSKSLETLERLMVTHADKHNDIDATRTGNMWRMSKLLTDCAGMSFSECLSVNSGVQFRPVVGMHFRNGDGTSFQRGNSDNRNPVEMFVDYLNCAKNLANSLGYDSPLYILATDNSRLKTAVNEWQSGPLLVDEVSINVPIDVIANTVVMPTAPPVHVALVEDQSTERMVDAMSEIMLLASADALMMSKSGFSFLSSTFGGFSEPKMFMFIGRKCISPPNN